MKRFYRLAGKEINLSSFETFLNLVQSYGIYLNQLKQKFIIITLWLKLLFPSNRRYLSLWWQNDFKWQDMVPLKEFKSVKHICYVLFIVNTSSLRSSNRSLSLCFGSNGKKNILVKISRTSWYTLKGISFYKNSTIRKTKMEILVHC